jgi:GrpB-like predicted nucleotidyltransferase (UPF0157 family)
MEGKESNHIINTLTPAQERWVEHLSDNDRVEIKPYDPGSTEKFESIKQKIRSILGEQIRIEHCGATSMGISGQDEIDIYLPVPEDEFDSLLSPLRSIFGEPRSLYPKERARFVTNENGETCRYFSRKRHFFGVDNGFDRCLLIHYYSKVHKESYG